MKALKISRNNFPTLLSRKAQLIPILDLFPADA